MMSSRKMAENEVMRPRDDRGLILTSFRDMMVFTPTDLYRVPFYHICRAQGKGNPGGGEEIYDL